MNKLILEVGMELDKNIIYYHDMLIKNGLSLVFSCITHDVYYTKEKLDGLTENEMKRACVRLRFSDGINKKENNKSKLLKQEQKLIKDGYTKVFDTIKFDFQYANSSMKSRIQLQDIKDIGLLVYYDNPDVYHLPLEEQRNKLLDELNTYGFDFRNEELGLDKLRTLYYKKKMYSLNQNA